MGDELLSALKGLRWSTAFRTYGNAHATLIGLLVDWWVDAAPAERWALEGGPSFAHLQRGIGGGLCDAILGQADRAKGVVEVEGTRHPYTIDKLGSFFGSALEDLKGLEFAIFLAYAYTPQGRGEGRVFPPPPFEEFTERGLAITRAYPARQIAILSLEKTFERQRRGPRARNEYYMGTPSRIRGALIQDGDVLGEIEIVAGGPQS